VRALPSRDRVPRGPPARNISGTDVRRAKATSRTVGTLPGDERRRATSLEQQPVRAVTPEVAGSSPVAPAQKAAALGGFLRSAFSSRTAISCRLVHFLELLHRPPRPSRPLADGTPPEPLRPYRYRICHAVRTAMFNPRQQRPLRNKGRGRWFRHGMGRRRRRCPLRGKDTQPTSHAAVVGTGSPTVMRVAVRPISTPRRRARRSAHLCGGVDWQGHSHRDDQQRSPSSRSNSCHLLLLLSLMVARR